MLERSWDKLNDDKFVSARRKPEQSLVRVGWWERLEMIDGVGPMTAQNIHDWFTPDLRRMSIAVEYLTNPGYYKRGSHPAGVGPATIKKAREFFMLPDGVALAEVNEQTGDVMKRKEQDEG